MNYIEQVAKMLDVEIGEEFEIRTKTSSLGIYRFTNTALVDKNNHFVKSDILVALLNGKYTIKRLTTINSLWKPKIGDIYYMPNLEHLGVHFGLSQVTYWHGNTSDEILYRRGLVCKTKEEAELLCKSILDFVKEYREE